MGDNPENGNIVLDPWALMPPPMSSCMEKVPQPMPVLGPHMCTHGLPEVGGVSGGRQVK